MVVVVVTAAAVVVVDEKEVRAVYIPRTNLNVLLAIVVVLLRVIVVGVFM